MFVLFDFYASQIMHYEPGIFHASRTTKCPRNQGRIKGEGKSTAIWLTSPIILLLAVPRFQGCSVFSSLVVLDVMWRVVIYCSHCYSYM